MRQDLSHIAKILLVSVCIAGVTACSKDTLVDDGNMTTDRIGFGITETDTRASVVTDAELSTMGIFGYYTGASNWSGAAGSSTPDYFYNQKVSKSGSVWSYSPAKFWPVVPNKLTFFAYAPHSTDASVNGKLTFSPESATGAPTLSYTIENDLAKQVDLLCATPQTDRTKTDQSVQFVMSHALTRISFSALLGPDEGGKNYTATVKGIAVTDVKKSGTLDLGSGVWNPTADKDTYTLTTAKGINATGDNHVFQTDRPVDFVSRSLTPADGYLMLMPQTFGNEAKVSITVNFKGGALDEDVTAEFALKDILIDGQGKWKEGDGVDYRFAINGKYITATATVWTPAGQGATVVDGLNYLSVSDKDFEMGKWAMNDTRLTVKTNLQNWSAKIEGNTPWLTLRNVATGTAVPNITGVSGEELRFAVEQIPDAMQERTGHIRITAGTMSLDVLVVQTENDQEFMLRLSTSEMHFIGRKYDSNTSTWKAPEPQTIKIAYGPTNNPYTMTLTPFSGGGIGDILPSPPQSDATEMVVSLAAIDPNSEEVKADPFYERSSRLGFTVRNADNTATITKQVYIKQTFYSLQVTQGTLDYYMQGYPYTFTIKANSPWVATIENGGILENVSGTSGNGNTGTGEYFQFRVKDYATPDETAKVTFSSPDDLFPPQTFDIVAQNALPNSYIVYPGDYKDVPVTKAYRVWKYDRDLKDAHPGGELPGGTLEMKLLWQDTKGLVTGIIPLGGAGQNARFRVQTASGKSGNAVVAFTINGTIYWSWHLWITDYNPGSDYLQLGSDVLMDRNLGATNNAPPVDNNDVSSVGLKYQGGRKDPWTGASGWTSPALTTRLPIYDINDAELILNQPGGVQSNPLSPAYANLADPIKNPMTYYKGAYGNSSWYGAFENIRDDLWGKKTYNIKGDFDPCPQGWRVPPYLLLTRFSTPRPTGNGLLIDFDNANNAFFPYSGIYNAVGSLGAYGTHTVFWTVSTSGTSSGIQLRANLPFIAYNARPAFAYAIRCVKE